MFDVFTLFNTPQYDIQIFHVSENWKVWNKPKGSKVVNMFLFGGGGGGGGGAEGVAGTTNRSGGGGGGSSAHARYTFLSIMLPDVLYVKTGRGGNGGINGATGTTGENGQPSYVSLVPSEIGEDVIAYSGGGGSGGGGGKINGGGGTAGTPGAIATNGNAKFSCLAFKTFTVGASGTFGNLTSAGTAVTALSSNIFCGGGGGAGTTNTNANSAGGGITGAGLIASIAGTTGATPASAGYFSNVPFCAVGGVGGGSSGTGTGSYGGDAGYGCGGGGGGGGVTGGVGGRGGDGIVIIISN